MKFLLVILIGFLFYGGLQYYFFRRLKGSAPLVISPRLFNIRIPGKAKIAFLVWVNLFPVLSLLVLGYAYINRIDGFVPPESPLISWLLVYPFWIWLLIVVQSVIWFLTLDAVLLVFALFRGKAVLGSRKMLYLRTMLVFAFAGYMAGDIVNNYRDVEVRRVEYRKAGLPEALKGFRIALIADVQADYYNDEERVGRYVNLVNAQNPDLILIAGDVITGTPKYISVAAKLLGRLKAPGGVYACIGDHDNWAYRFNTARSRREVKSALASRGIEMVDNGIRQIRADSASIGILFVTNTYVEKVSGGELSALMEKCGRCDVRIFLTHQPREKLMRFAQENGFDLYLSGHTHGGQITFLTPFGMWTPTSLETPYIEGDFHFGEMLAIVNRGLGMSIAPVRYNSQPEITLITLLGETGKQLR